MGLGPDSSFLGGFGLGLMEEEAPPPMPMPGFPCLVPSPASSEVLKSGGAGS